MIAVLDGASPTFQKFQDLPHFMPPDTYFDERLPKVTKKAVEMPVV